MGKERERILKTKKGEKGEERRKGGKRRVREKEKERRKKKRITAFLCMRT